MTSVSRRASTKFGAWPEAGPGLTERLEALRRAALMAGDRFVEGRSAMALGLVAMWELRHDDARRLFEDA